MPLISLYVFILICIICQLRRLYEYLNINLKMCSSSLLTQISLVSMPNLNCLNRVPGFNFIALFLWITANWHISYAHFINFCLDILGLFVCCLGEVTEIHGSGIKYLYFCNYRGSNPILTG